MPPISIAEYQARRLALAKQLPPEAIAIIPSAQEVTRNADNHYRFRQDSDFFYLTGFDEPDALLVIMAEATGQAILFNRPRNPIQEQWTGRRLGQTDACQTLGLDAAYSIDELSSVLPKLLKKKKQLYTMTGRYPYWEKMLGAIISHDALPRVNLAPITHRMRLIKSEAEIEVMRHVAKITAAAHKQAMTTCRQLAHEYQLEAALLHTLGQHGCRNVAYDTIVASGEHACVLHYTANNAPLNDGELVLIDAGGELYNYAADVTRTFPINGCFSEAQRQLYELVLQAQQAGIAQVKPGTPWLAIQRTIVDVLTSGLIDLGILKGSKQALLQDEAYKAFYMHQSGHWLGLDVHDCIHDDKHRADYLLEPGMVLTVEPGLYLNASLPMLDDHWKGIGIRIEDDILVTPDGHENLTVDVPVDVHEIESLMHD